MARTVPEPRRRDVGRLISRILCGLFGLIGAIPLLAVVLVRSPPMQAWAAAETARLLHNEFGVEASYDVSLELVPLRLSIRELVVPGSDGKGPALRAKSIAVTPRAFSLLAGKLDAGDIEIERPTARLVFEGGKLKNLKYRLRARQRSPSGKLERAPFTSLAVTDATFDVSYDGIRVDSKSVEMDVIAASGMAFELALRLADGTLVTERTGSESPKVRIEADALCSLDLRVSQTPEQSTVRHLSFSGVLDDNPARGSRPSCQTATHDDNPHSVLARLS